MADEQPPLVYAKAEVNGILVRPDSRELMKQAVAGRRIHVRSGNDYINLYHVFERLRRRDKRLTRHTLVRRQIDESTWALFVVPPGGSVPEVGLEDKYDPTRGRYKRMAWRLAAGEALVTGTSAEAIKARRAWQHYVPRENRQDLKPYVAKRGDKFAVLIVRKGR